MGRVIIGIHGLGNKPSATVLKDWWISSIHDGLAAIGFPKIPFKFELLYWADLFYPEPLHAEVPDPKHPAFIRHPYKRLAPALYSKISWRKLMSLERLERIEHELFRNDRILHGFEGITDQLIKIRFSELDSYLKNKTGYGEAKDRPTRDVILERLGDLLLKHQHDKIMIIAHSMGTIITYDFFSQPDCPFEIDRLVTLGSPLGQAALADKFACENPILRKLDTPEAIHKWINLADLNDVIALDPTLGDDYAPNSMGVRPEDIIVDNRYEWEGEKNPHAIYGYLQTHAAARLICDFLLKERHTLAIKAILKMAQFYDRFLKIPEKRIQRSPSRPERPPKTRKQKSRSQEFEHQIST